MYFLRCKGNLSRYDSFTLNTLDQLGLGVEEAEAAGVAGAGADAFPGKILIMTVPQVGHLPLMALRPFFIVSSTPLAISFLALHLTQYPSAIKTLPFALHARMV